jgi:hypothetical protein
LLVRRLSVATLLAAAWLVLTAATAAPALADDGWRTHRRPAAGFALDTPASWLDITSSKTKVLDQVAKRPELASLVQIARSNDLIKFLGADMKGFPNVNVISTVVGPVGLHALVSANVAQIEGLSFVKGPVSVSAVRLPAGGSELVTYKEAPQGRTLLTLQYYFVHRGRAFIVTYTTDPAPDAATKATVTRSARSFRFLGVRPVS